MKSSANSARFVARSMVLTLVVVIAVVIALGVVRGPYGSVVIQEPAATPSAVRTVAQGPGDTSPAYRDLAQITGLLWLTSRVVIWIAAEVHLMFAAFVLGVPMFALVVEIVGWRTGDLKYDRLAREFTKLLVVAFSTTATFGALLLFLLVTLYPRFFSYLADVFTPTMAAYALLFFGEGFSLYLYWYGWDRLMDRKGLHVALGVALNIFGTALMFIANAWATFAISPAGIDESGNLISLGEAIRNHTWMPLNIHRLIANVAFGGAIVGMYAAFRFLGARTEEDRAHYDWMGYVGNFIAVVALIPLPFAGYWFGREIYGFNQQMGITMMGGFLSWLWIIQAVLIGVLFLTANYYLWIGMSRIQGGERYKKYIKYLLVVLGLGFLVWATPHSLVASLEEARRIGAAHHPLLGVLGVMSAKNTAVNLMILTTFLSFLLYRRANKVATVTWARAGKMLQGAVVAVAAATVILLGIYGYFVPAIVRIGFSLYQVLAVLSALILGTIIDIFLFRRAQTLGTIAWGRMPGRSQYALLLLAVTFTWLMGLMGYARNAIRQHWHVFGVMRDTSPEAFSPTLGYAASVISICVLLFLGLMAFVFWLGGLEEKPAAVEAKAPPLIPRPAPVASNPSA
ncbi:MAG: cytochrome ubiquinol oxidase subunit I, partial [Anaerolineae bacterium]